MFSENRADILLEEFQASGIHLLFGLGIGGTGDNCGDRSNDGQGTEQGEEMSHTLILV